jgi:hypothetical protein
MSLNAAAWIPLFPKDDVPFILTMVLRCCGGLRKNHEREREDRISNRLRMLIRRDEAFRRSTMVVDREVPVFDDDAESEEPIGRIDFRFLSPRRQTASDWHFVIEAKRLHVTFKASGWKPLVSEYVTGHQGMMCFIDERYARGLTESAMLGYVFDGDTEKADNAISASITANAAKLKCAAPSRLVPSQILNGPTGISESVHNLPKRRFTIYHLFAAV